MKKNIHYAVAALVAVVLIYLGSIVFVGEQVESTISRLEADLIQSDELIVHRFEYERGFGGGVLRYDLELSPNLDSMTGELLTEIAAVTGNARLEGALDLSHGPWVGSGMGFAVAGTKLEFTVGDEVRRLLPQYPGSAPAAVIYASIGFDGSASLRLETLAYDGRLVMQDESISLTTAGVGAELLLNDDSVGVGLDIGRVRLSDGAREIVVDGMTLIVQTNNDVSELELFFDLDELSVSDEDSETQLDVQSVAGSTISRRLLPGIWLGDNDYAIERVSLAADGIAGEALATRISAGIDEKTEGLLATHSLLSVSELISANGTINGIELGIGYENINAKALSDFLQLSEELSVDSIDSDELMVALLSLANALSADGLTLRVAPIAFSVVEPGDTSAAFSVGLNGLNSIEEATTEELFEAIALSGEFSITADAARKLIEIGITSSDDTLSVQELETAVDSRFQQLISAMEESGFVAISDMGISSRIEVARGAMRVNGEESDAGTELLAAALSQFGNSGVLPANTDALDFPTEALYENVSLVTGFLPDPYTVELVAGGDNPASSELGTECTGNVTSNQPDVTLNYTAGSDYGLSLYAESASDTTLIVLTPNGWQCDDDSYSYGDLNPNIRIDSPQSGDYLIWIGTYDGGVADAELGISEY